jgi:hypothetical protein
MEDQQLAGLIMWVPAGALYLLAGLILAARLISDEGEPASRPPPAGRDSAPLARHGVGEPR